MIEEELRNIWKNAPETEKIKFDLSKLLIELNNKMNHIEKAIVARDRREIIASVVGIFWFSYFAYEIPFPITKIACVLIVFYFVYVIYKLRSVRKKSSSDHLNMSLSFREQLQQQKIFMTQQKNLLNSVLYWYVLPPFLMNILFIIGLGDPAIYNWEPMLIDLIPIQLHEKIRTIIILMIFYGYIVWLNRRAARIRYQPMIEDIERAQQQLTDVS